MTDVLDEAAAGIGVVSAFQPVVALPSETPVGCEALARWPSLDGPPAADVFAHAERNKTLDLLDRECIRSAAAGALAGGCSPGTLLFINCEPSTAGTELFADSALTQAAGSFRLVFELTERGLLTNPRALLRKVADLRTRGIAIALDDVGAHVDSLARHRQPRYREAGSGVGSATAGLAADPHRGRDHRVRRADRCDHPRRGHRDRRTPRAGTGLRRHPGPGLSVRSPRRADRRMRRRPLGRVAYPLAPARRCHVIRLCDGRIAESCGSPTDTDPTVAPYRARRGLGGEPADRPGDTAGVRQPPRPHPRHLRGPGRKRHRSSWFSARTCPPTWAPGSGEWA